MIHVESFALHVHLLCVGQRKVKKTRSVIIYRFTCTPHTASSCGCPPRSPASPYTGGQTWRWSGWPPGVPWRQAGWRSGSSGSGGQGGTPRGNRGSTGTPPRPSRLPTHRNLSRQHLQAHKGVVTLPDVFQKLTKAAKIWFFSKNLVIKDGQDYTKCMGTLVMAHFIAVQTLNSF